MNSGAWAVPFPGIVGCLWMPASRVPARSRKDPAGISYFGCRRNSGSPAERSGSDHPLAAVDDEVLAGDEIGLDGGEESNELRHVLRRPDAAEGDAPDELGLARPGQRV